MRRLHDLWRAAAVCALTIWMAGACAAQSTAPGAPSRPASAAPPAQDAGAPAAAAPPAANAPALQSLRVGYANVAAAHAPLYVALESGAFARHGLDVDLTNLGSS